MRSLPSRSRLIWIAVLVLLSASGLLFVPIRSEAQSPPVGAEVRLAARANTDGSVSVGLQHRVDGRWRGVVPTRSKIPADSELGDWRVSSAVAIPARQVQLEISTLNRNWIGDESVGAIVVRAGDRTYQTPCEAPRLRGDLRLRLKRDEVSLEALDADCEYGEWRPFAEQAALEASGEGDQLVRVVGRLDVNNAVELGLQRFVQGAWEAMRQPGPARLRLNIRGDWRFSAPFVLPTMTPVVSGELRPGVSIETVSGRLQVTIYGEVFPANCGYLELDSMDRRIAVLMLDSVCGNVSVLTTICSPHMAAADCDTQGFQVYLWEGRHDQSANRIELSMTEAERVVQAVYSDFAPRRAPPGVAVSNHHNAAYSPSDHTVYLVLDERQPTFDVVLHETAHAVAYALHRDNTHGSQFTSALLELWRRYAPWIDIHAARADALRSRVQVSAWRPRAQSDRGVAIVREVICGLGADAAESCRAFDGGASGISAAELVGRYVGWGNLPNGWYWAGEDNEGMFEATLTLESEENRADKSVARLQTTCTGDDELELYVFWREVPVVPAALTYRIGEDTSRTERWATHGDWKWGEDEWAAHRSLDADTFLQRLVWLAGNGGELVVQYEDAEGTHSARFDLTGVFETPVQSNLVQCGASKDSNPEAPVIDWGRFGESFWWGVDEDEDPLKTYVVKDTTISGSTREARLSVQCEDGGLEIDLYWEVDHDLDWTVRYRIDNGEVQSEEWRAGWGSWGDTDYKWTGREDARDLIAQLAWAAQSDGTLIVEAHERHNPNRRYTATFDLDGLFETPVQPNLARCGSY